MEKNIKGHSIVISIVIKSYWIIYSYFKKMYLFIKIYV